MTRAALDQGDFGLRKQSEHLAGFLPHILRPRVADDLNRDASVECRQTRGESLLCRKWPWPTFRSACALEGLTATRIVAQAAGVGDLLVVGRHHRIELATFRIVD